MPVTRTLWDSSWSREIYDKSTRRRKLFLLFPFKKFRESERFPIKNVCMTVIDQKSHCSYISMFTCLDPPLPTLITPRQRYQHLVYTASWRDTDTNSAFYTPTPPPPPPSTLPPPPLHPVIRVIFEIHLRHLSLHTHPFLFIYLFLNLIMRFCLVKIVRRWLCWPTVKNYVTSSHFFISFERPNRPNVPIGHNCVLIWKQGLVTI